MNRIAGRMGILALLSWPLVVAATPCPSLQVAEWLLGDWTSAGGEAGFQQSWSAAGPQTFAGSGSELTGPAGGGHGTEALRLVEMQGQVFYLAKAGHNELPVAFRLTECALGHLVFENSGHDPPQHLKYRLEAGSRMTVTVGDGAAQDISREFERRAVTADDGAAVLAAEDTRFGAMVRADGAELGNWLAEDLQYAHSTGKVEDRGQFLDSIASGRTRYLTIEPIERQAVLLGDRSAIVRGRARFEVMAGDARLDLQLRYLAVYADSGGRWRLRSWQSMRLPQ